MLAGQLYFTSMPMLVVISFHFRFGGTPLSIQPRRLEGRLGEMDGGMEGSFFSFSFSLSLLTQLELELELELEHGLLAIGMYDSRYLSYLSHL